MHHVQPDGSTPDMCGNGVRCAAKWAHERFDTTEIVVDTGAGPHPARIDGDRVAVEMHTPSFDPDDVPLARDDPLFAERVEGLTVTAVSTGVPHAVAFEDGLASLDLADIAPPIRHAAVFPEGANVTIANEMGPNTYAQRTYERGVEGETDACGTGAVAVAAAAVETGRADAGVKLTVEPPGGSLTVSASDQRAY
jgi:diaminopimelate epimerase